MTTNGHNGHGPTVSPLVPILPGLEFTEGSYSRLKMRLDLYEDTIVACRYNLGKPGPLYVVDPLDLATALSDLSVSTGLLPEGVLFWQRSDGAERLGVYVPPKVWPVSVVGEERTWYVPLPGLVFVGKAMAYQIYAVKTRPTGYDVKLYNAPCPNVSGAVCTGSAPFPPASAATIWQAVDAFFTSGFNNHLAGGKSKRHPSILEMWRELHEAGAETYPLDDLIENSTSFKRVVENG